MEDTMADQVDFRPLNVTLRPQSPALDAYASTAKVSSDVIAAGFNPRPDLDLTYRGGRTIADLVFINCYLGGAKAWDHSDRTNIDRALSHAMSDADLEHVIGQYYSKPISSRALKSRVVAGAVGKRFFKDQAEALAARLLADGVLGHADPGSSVINLMLPRGVVLVDGNSDGSEEKAAPHARSVLVDDEQVDSKHGLGGFHGSVHANGTTVYYAVGVYSEGDNGIVAFDEPWKNVVATFYHELCEARTDPDVEDVIRTGDESRLGWYSDKGGEIGDIPMSLAGAHLERVMVEAPLVKGGTAPVQLEWSNHVHGPEGPDHHPH
jgi:hypothetical protein